ncbi:MAG: nitroreductase family protein [Anaerolineales bacterium]
MDFSKLIRTRYSVRAYESRPIDEEILQRVFEAFVLAPTAANRQPLGLVVIETEGHEDKLRRIYDRDWFASQPPLVVCACADMDVCWVRDDGRPYGDVDATIAMDHLILAATEEGLGTCWIGAFDPRTAREVLGLPEHVEPIAFTPLGYPADEPGRKVRKDLEDILHYGEW